MFVELQAHKSSSADIFEVKTAASMSPQELRYTQELAELPPQKLKLKLGVPIMLLHKLQRETG